MRVRRSRPPRKRLIGWKAWRLIGLAGLTSCAHGERAPILLTPQVNVPTILREDCPTSSRPEVPAGLDAPAQPTHAELLAAYQARGVFIATLMGFTLEQEADGGVCAIRKDAAVGLLDDVTAAGAAIGATPAGLRGRLD